MIECRFTAIMVEYAVNSATGTYRIYNPATKQVIFKRDVKWHKFYVSNAQNDPTLSDFTEGTLQKTTIRENTRNNKENDNKLDL